MLVVSICVMYNLIMNLFYERLCKLLKQLYKQYYGPGGFRYKLIVHY